MKSKIFALLFGIMSAVSASAQLMPSTAYFMDKNPLRHTLNPAFHTTDKFYIGMPGLSLFKFGIGNNALAFEDVYAPRMIDGQNTTVLFLNKAWENGRQSFLYNVKDGVNISSDFNLQLLACGFKIRPLRSYVTLGLNLRMDMQALFPETFWQSILDGGLQGTQTENKLSLNELFIGTNVYGEAALGYTYDHNDKWSFGLKAKYLYGLGAIRTNLKNLDITLGKEEWTITGDADVNISFPIEIETDENGKVGDITADNATDGVLPGKNGGTGFAVDLGATFRPIDRLQISAAVLDLGGIKYKNNLHKLRKEGDFVFDGLEYDINSDQEFSEYFDKYTDMLENMYRVEQNPSSFRYRLYPKLMIGGELGFWKNRVSVGLLSKTTFAYEKTLEEMMLSANFKPLRTISFSASYSLLDGAWSNLGFGLNLNLGAFNWFLIADQIPLRYAKGSNIILPTRTKSFNLAMGINFAIRDKKAEKEAKEKNTIAAEEDLFAPADSVELDKPLFAEDSTTTITNIADSTPAVKDSALFLKDTTALVADTTPVVTPIAADTTPVMLDTTPAVKPVVTDTTPKVQVLEREEPNKMIAVPEGELIEPALYGIKFSNTAGEMAIMKASYPLLNSIADRMLVNPSFTLEIKGHYFLENDGPRNRFYGKQRALLVKWYLTERGVDPSRIDIEGVGAAYPVGPNNTLEDKKKNTRMELRMFK